MNVIEEFLEPYQNKKNTIKAYKIHLKKYFQAIKVTDPDKYFTAKRDYDNDFKTFLESVKHLAPQSKTSRVRVVQSFLRDNEILLSKQTRKIIKQQIKNRESISIDRIPKQAELKKLLTYANAKERALFMVSATSGTRIDELLQLEPDDVFLDYDPPMIVIRPEIAKNGRKRVTFITPETKDMVMAWLDIRDKYLYDAVEKCKVKPGKQQMCVKKLDDKRLFPFSYTTALTMWIKLITKAGLTDKSPGTGRYMVHIHTLRKYFMINLEQAGIPTGIVDTLAGHQTPLSQAYRKYDPGSLQEEYKKGMSNLLVFETSADVSEIEEQMKEKDKQIQKMQESIDSLENKYGDLLHELVVKKKK